MGKIRLIQSAKQELEIDRRHEGTKASPTEPNKAGRKAGRQAGEQLLLPAGRRHALPSTRAVGGVLRAPAMELGAKVVGYTRGGMGPYC